MYRSEILSNLHWENFQACFGALNAINAALPEKYRIRVSSIKYNELHKSEVFAICYECNKEVKYEDIEVYDYILAGIGKYLLGQESKQAWVCPLCQETLFLLETEFKTKINKEPEFLQCVPQAPQRKDGLLDRTSYNKKVKNWIMIFLSELEHSMAKFRRDYSDNKNEYLDIPIDFRDEMEDKENTKLIFDMPEIKEAINQ